ncbi:unnamed protein product [Cuscuta epithymum]|uniref:DUF4283 domain-containing protein n=1 Tax=Cuscuta epithymum TaxID=186058 RepID=A0AAV0EVI0_9ASTE|nr:unnamed protein product [Cuscuta epithymum]
MESVQSQPAPPPSAEEQDHLNRSTKKIKHGISVGSGKRSFAETVAAHLGVQEQANSDWCMEVEDDLSDDEDFIPDDNDIPRVIISKERKKEIRQQWRKALIIKTMGKIPFPVLQSRLLRMWNPHGRLEFIDLGYGYYSIKMDLQRDYFHILMEGPWKIFDQYIIVNRWVPNFQPSLAKPEKMAVWVRLPGLPTEYFVEDIIKAILEKVGTPLKLDRTTMSVSRGRFARAAVEVDLLKPLVPYVWVGKRKQAVEYEGLHIICFGCG